MRLYRLSQKDIPEYLREVTFLKKMLYTKVVGFQKVYLLDLSV